MKIKKLTIIILVGFLLISGIAWTQYNALVYMKQGGAELVTASGGQATTESGGEIEVESGGIVAVESGGEVEIASGGILDIQAGASVTMVQNIEIVTESDTLTAAQTGLLSVYRPLAAKALTELPPAAAGLMFSFMIDDADSLLLFPASGDSLIDSDGSAYVTASSVVGNVTVKAIDATRWLMLAAIGTWTNY